MKKTSGVRHSAEFKAEAVKLVRTIGLKKAADKMGCAPASIVAWRKAQVGAPPKPAAPAAVYSGPDVTVETIDLDDELAAVTRERDDAQALARRLGEDNRELRRALKSLLTSMEVRDDADRHP